MYETFRKGEVAVLKVQLWALEHGFHVSKPIVETRYDLVLDVAGKLYRVQVKYADIKKREAANSIHLDLRKTCRGNGKVKLYSASEVDVILAYLPSVEQIVWIEPSRFAGKTAVTIRLAPAKNNQKIGVVMLGDLRCPHLQR